jgi:hypothetical protein
MLSAGHDSTWIVSVETSESQKVIHSPQVVVIICCIEDKRALAVCASLCQLDTWLVENKAEKSKQQDGCSQCLCCSGDTELRRKGEI